ALGGPERHAEEIGDLLVSEVLEEGQAQGLALGRRQGRDGLANNRAPVLTPGLLGRAGARFGYTRNLQALRVCLDFDPTTPPAQFIEHAQVCDPQHPGAKSASCGVEGAGLAPDRHEDILDDLLGSGGADRLSGQVEDERRVTAVEWAKGLLPAGGKLA